MYNSILQHDPITGLFFDQSYASLMRLHEQMGFASGVLINNQKQNFPARYADNLEQILQELDKISSQELDLLFGQSTGEPVNLFAFGVIQKKYTVLSQYIDYIFCSLLGELEHGDDFCVNPPIIHP